MKIIKEDADNFIIEDRTPLSILIALSILFVLPLLLIVTSSSTDSFWQAGLGFNRIHFLPVEVQRFIYGIILIFMFKLFVFDKTHKITAIVDKKADSFILKKQNFIRKEIYDIPISKMRSMQLIEDSFSFRLIINGSEVVKSGWSLMYNYIQVCKKVTSYLHIPSVETRHR